MVVLNPADHYEMLAAVKAAAQHNGRCTSGWAAWRWRA